MTLDIIAERAGHEALMKVDDTGSLIVGDPQGIPCQNFKPRQIPSLNIVANCYYISYLLN
jgi:hypothetical protein